MYYRDHAPPHVHAEYGEFELIVEIETSVVAGRFPPRATQHVLEWVAVHRDELREDWRLARENRPLRPIPPLE